MCVCNTVKPPNRKCVCVYVIFRIQWRIHYKYKTLIYCTVPLLCIECSRDQVVLNSEDSTNFPSAQITHWVYLPNSNYSKIYTQNIRVSSRIRVRRYFCISIQGSYTFIILKIQGFPGLFHSFTQTSFPGINLEFQGFKGFSALKLKSRVFRGVRTLNISTNEKACNKTCNV